MPVVIAVAGDGDILAFGEGQNRVLRSVVETGIAGDMHIADIEKL